MSGDQILSRSQDNEKVFSSIAASSSGSLTVIPASNVSIEGGLSANTGGLKHKIVELQPMWAVTARL